MNLNTLSYDIRGCIFKVYNNLGPGLFESVYQYALEYELKKYGFRIRSQVPIPVIYNNHKLEAGFRADILVEEKILLEIKSIEALAPIHHMQLLTYLKISGYQLGILVNFNTDKINKSIHRKILGTDSASL